MITTMFSIEACIAKFVPCNHCGIEAKDICIYVRGQKIYVIRQFGDNLKYHSFQLFSLCCE